MKKLLLYILILTILVGLYNPKIIVSAADPLGDCTISVPVGQQGPPQVITNQTKAQCSGADMVWSPYYNLLAPLPCEGTIETGCVDGKLTNFDPAQASNLGVYLNLMITLFIGICAVLAVIMIVMGGIEYMTSELISNKEEGKKRITNAVFGLLLALGSWTLLNTINPDLLNTSLSSLINVEVSVELGGEGTNPLDERTIKDQLTSVGITCPKSGGIGAMVGIAQSYIGRSNYSMELRNTVSDGKANVDCSSYVSQTYVCAGLSNPGGTSAGIFGSGSTSVTSISADGTTVNGIALKIGDLIGWTAGGEEKYGHVMMYIGNGKMIDAQGQGGVAERPVSSYIKRIKYIKPV